MSSLTLSTHRSIAVLARRQLAFPRIASSSRAINNDSKNGSNPGDDKPKQERLEDIFADLFDEKPLPSLRPPTDSEDTPRSFSAPVNPDPENTVLPSWLTNSQYVDTPSRSAFDSISNEASSRGIGRASRQVTPPASESSNSNSTAGSNSSSSPSRFDRAPRSRPEPSISQGRSKFGLRPRDTEVGEGERKMDRTRMTPRESKAFDQISSTSGVRDRAPSTPTGSQAGKAGGLEGRSISARLGQLDPADRYSRGSSSSSSFPPNYPHSQPRAIDPPISARTPRPVRPTMPAHEVDQAAHDEFDRVKEIISGLGNDLAVWEWARENVFRTNPTTDASTTDGATEVGDRDAFPGSYSLVLAYLIKTFREEFHNPHLALSAFTLARSHSIRSYVAGCSTAAYNEALSTYWGSFRNLRRVEECVREMSVNGVGWDRHTSKILSGIIENLSETQLSSPATQFGAGQRKLEAEFGTEVLLRLAALEKRVQADVESKEKGVRMLLGQLHAEKRRREAAGRPAELPTVPEEEVREWDVQAEEREAERSGWADRGTYESRGSERSYDRSSDDRRGSERREHSGPRREDRLESARPSWR